MGEDGSSDGAHVSGEEACTVVIGALEDNRGEGATAWLDS